MSNTDRLREAARALRGRAGAVPPGSDAVDRAAEVMIEHTRTSIEKCHCGWGDLGQSHAEHVAQALDEAGLLATEEHDRQVQADYWSGKYPRAIAAHDRAVAARALREAADEMVTTINEHAGGGNLVRQRRVIDVARLRERADRIEERR